MDCPTMIISVDGKCERPGARSLNNGPPIIRASDTEVDFFPAALTDVSDEHSAERAIEAWSPGVPQTERPNFTLGCCTDKRVIGDRETAAGGRNVDA